MALLKCRECGKEISSQAKACPNCGAKPINKAAAGCGAIIGLFVVVVLIVSIFDKDGLPPDAQSSENQTASVVCSEFIKKRLRDPDSAQFITEPLHTPAQHNRDGSYFVALTVRAANGFGGKDVETFNCTVAKETNGDWDLQNLVNYGE